MSLPTARVGANDQVDALASWNRLHLGPPQNGFSRSLPQQMVVSFQRASPSQKLRAFSGGYLAQSPSRNPVWGASVRVEGAYRLRLHISLVRLPIAARMWVYGQSDPPSEFGLELKSPEGDLWTPSVGGDVLFFEVELPAAEIERERDWGVTADKVLEVVALNSSGEPASGGVPGSVDTSCLVDATCADFSGIDIARHAIAQLEFVIGGLSYVCSGGLVVDTKSGGAIPYLLTANQCFSDQSAASSLEAFFDDYSSSCGGPAPDRSSLPRSHGSTLLATGRLPAQSDFTFVRLNSLPPDRVFLGWTASSPSIVPGQPLYRISHPAPAGSPLSQAFSKTVFDVASAECQGLPRPTFIYSQRSIGGTFAGSTGAPVVLNGLVLGQLTGLCGPTAMGCDSANEVVDGAFSATYPSISRWLNPGDCTPSSTALCLNTGRFKVTATFDAGSSGSGDAQVVRLTPDTGYLWFFANSNVEAVIKVLNGCSFGGYYWVFAGGLTNVNVVMTVTDTQTGTKKSYTNPPNTTFQPIQDTAAFATCP